MDAVAGAPNLQVAIHTLRCSLRGCGPGGSDETVLFRHSRYLLNPALWIVQDVDAFRAAYERGLCAGQAGRTTEATLAFEQARATYTGDHLADPYEESASGTRVALQDRWLHVLDQLGALYSQAGTWEQAIACYCEILLVHDHREDVDLHNLYPDQEYSSMTITRSDGKALTIAITRETGGYFEFELSENVIKFSSTIGMHADMSFQ